jgi:hypothetical protein
MPLEILEDDVAYMARTKLLELATEVADTRNINKVRDKIKQGATIVKWLQALDYGGYLEKTQRDVIIRAIVEIAEINDFPIAPSLGNTEPYNVSIGGSTTVTNNYSSDSTAFSNADVDTPSEVVDSFSVASARGAVWHYTIRNQAGTSQRSGIVVASWLVDGTLVWNEESSGDIGTTIGTVTLSVVYSAPNITLVATTSVNNFIVEGDRFLING